MAWDGVCPTLREFIVPSLVVSDRQAHTVDVGEGDATHQQPTVPFVGKVGHDYSIPVIDVLSGSWW